MHPYNVCYVPYSTVLHRHGKALYDGLVETVTEHLGEIAKTVDAVNGGHFLVVGLADIARHVLARHVLARHVLGCH